MGGPWALGIEAGVVGQADGLGSREKGECWLSAGLVMRLKDGVATLLKLRKLCVCV